MDSKTKQELTASSNGSSAQPKKKLPYRQPELKRLGAVADLTLGQANSTGEARGTFKAGT
jgi:hypothetical protein